MRNCPPRKCEIARREETTVTALLREAARDAVKKRTAAPEQAEALRSLVWRLAPRMPGRFKTAAQLARFKRTQREFDQVVLDLQLATPMAIQDRNSLVSSRQTIRLEKRPPRGSHHERFGRMSACAMLSVGLDPIPVLQDSSYRHAVQNKGHPMSLITVVLTLIVVGVLLWLINTYIPMAGPIKTILNLVVVIAVVLWLLHGFGVLGHSGEIRLPVIK